MNESLNEDGPLNPEQVAFLLQDIKRALSRDPLSLPQQQVLRLWWGTEHLTEAPDAQGVGPIYGALVDWQEGLASFDVARSSMSKRVDALLSRLRPK